MYMQISTVQAKYLQSLEGIRHDNKPRQGPDRRHRQVCSNFPLGTEQDNQLTELSSLSLSCVERIKVTKPEPREQLP